MSFTIDRLMGERVLVKGTDVAGTTGQTILDSTQWTEVNQSKAFDQATSAFEAAVDSFFAPLLEAAEATNKTLAPKPADPASYVVLTEPTVGVAAQPGNLIKLTHDSIVLRLIEQGDTNRLRWVGDDLEILEATPPTPATATPAAEQATPGTADTADLSSFDSPVVE